MNTARMNAARHSRGAGRPAVRGNGRRPGSRTRAAARLAAAFSASLALLVAAAGPALAAGPPPNDDISNATVIGLLPFHQTENITLATADPSTDPTQCNSGQPQTVWYKFTPAISQEVVFDPTLSTEDMNVGVYTGSPGALNLVTCGVGGIGDNGGAFLTAASGTTYWIMVSPGCCLAPPLILHLWVYRDAPPRAMKLSVTSATVDAGGNVTVSGTLDCSGAAPGGVTITGTVRQPVRRLHSVHAPYTAAAVCGGTQTWTALAQPKAGKFVAGHTDATINVTAQPCNLAGCTSVKTTTVIKLTR
jgi:hypothetical protein